MSVGYELQLSKRIQIILKILSVSGRFHVISRKNTLSWIPGIGVQGLIMLYLILCYNGPQYNGGLLYIYIFLCQIKNTKHLHIFINK